MATARTGTFYLTETVTLPAGTVAAGRIQGTIDLGAYVNVPTGQAIAVDQVDFILQSGADNSARLQGMVTGNAAIAMQLTDLNPGTSLVRASNQSLIASGSIQIDQTNNVGTMVTDLFPDNFGKLNEAFMVVNDTLYLVGGIDGANVSVEDLHVTVRVRAQVVKLSQENWMAIAIQSTASDN
jgi:hypothetical protein